MRPIHFFAWVRGARRQGIAATLCAVFSLGATSACADAPLSLLVPSRHIVSQPEAAARTDAPQKNGEKAAAKLAEKAEAQAAAQEKRADPEEVDILLSLMRPFLHEGVAVDMPQLFAVLRHDADAESSGDGPMPERRDLLGDVEEIRYLDQKAWGANVALDKPGLYQFIMEGRPWWDADRETFLRHQAKVTLPVHGVERGWNEAAGQSFEIVPLVRPFGLHAPALFSGRVLLDGQPLANAPVRMARINADGASPTGPWQQDMAAISNATGEFAFMLPQPGWWCCEAVTPGAPLKGPDGELKPVERAALFWLFVENPPAPRDTDTRKR
ncbi:MAG: DUF4198 domain-containing protein [Desulfovibrio sp.]|nr:DUF4198 domain-containing protein [Desulfovibrio sp.]